MSTFQSRTTVTAVLPPGVVPASVKAIARFEVLGLIGEGGMGRVYLARDPRLQRLVAIKVISDEHACDPVRERIFEDEARVPSMLIHANLCIVFDAGRHEGRPYIVMEYVRGSTLAHLIPSREGRGPGLDVARALEIARDVATGLHFMHGRGVIHRDLKPSNVMITEEGRAKVLDFGLARRRSALEGSRSGYVIGTPGYMAPEQCAGETADEGADIFAFGCMLYECLSGRAAFACRGVADYVRLLDGPGPDLEGLPEGTPPAVRTLVRDCTRRRRAERPASMGRALEVLSAGASVERASAPGNVPTELSRLIGREAELEHLAADLAAHRLVTLKGPGGVGKTRVAVEAAGRLRGRYADGVWFVDLSPLRDPGRVDATVAAALPFGCGPGAWDALREREALVILDNCEQVSDAAAATARALIEAGTGVTVLATSRGPLGVRGERIFQVPLLSCPTRGAEAAEIEGSESVRLFLDRAALTGATVGADEASLELVARICRRLEGMPLAIELAAAGAGATPLRHLAERIERGRQLGVMGDDQRPARQRTLDSAIAWSEEQLSPAERVLFRRLSVFRGGWSAEAAEAVCGDANGSCGEALIAGEDVDVLLASLCRRSLVVFEPERRGGGYRFLETVRLYARAALRRECGLEEVARLRGRHLAHYLGVAEEAAQGLRGGTEQSAWAALLDVEIDNMLAALEASVEYGRREDRLRLATALHRWWYMRGATADGMRHLAEAIAGAPGAGAEQRAAAHNGLGVLKWEAGRNEDAAEEYERALALWREAGKTGAAALANLGMVRQEQERLDEALACLDEAIELFDSAGDAWGANCARLNLGALLLPMKRPAEARRVLEACRPGFERAGDALRLGMTCHNLAVAHYDEGEDGQAVPLLGAALREAYVVGYEYGIALSLLSLGKIQARSGQDERAARLIGWADALWEATGARMPLGAEAEHAQVLRGLRERLGERVFATLWCGGASIDAVRASVRRFILHLDGDVTEGSLGSGL